MACGASHTAVLKQDGSVWVAGSNDYGQLGLGHTNKQTTPVQMAAVGGDVSVGWRLIQRPFAGGRLDLAPFGALGYRYQWYFLRYGAGTAAEGSVVDAAFSADPEWINQQYMTLSAGVRVRTIWDRLVLRASFQIARNVDIATPANGRELYLLNAATGEFEPTGASVEGIPETGITWNTTLGVGVRF